jgi:hypothetical protein
MNEKVLAHLIGHYGSIVYTRRATPRRQSWCEGLPPADLWDVPVFDGLDGPGQCGTAL